MNNTWQYRGKNGQVMAIGLSEERAKVYAQKYGGTAEPMPATHFPDAHPEE